MFVFDIDLDDQNLVQSPDLDDIIHDICNIDAIDDDEKDIETCISELLGQNDEGNILQIDTSELKKWLKPTGNECSNNGAAFLQRIKAIMGKLLLREHLPQVKK